MKNFRPFFRGNIISTEDMLEMLRDCPKLGIYVNSFSGKNPKDGSNFFRLPSEASTYMEKHKDDDFAWNLANAPKEPKPLPDWVNLEREYGLK